MPGAAHLIEFLVSGSEKFLEIPSADRARPGRGCSRYARKDYTGRRTSSRNRNARSGAEDQWKAPATERGSGGRSVSRGSDQRIRQADIRASGFPRLASGQESRVRAGMVAAAVAVGTRLLVVEVPQDGVLVAQTAEGLKGAWRCFRFRSGTNAPRSRRSGYKRKRGGWAGRPSQRRRQTLCRLGRARVVASPLRNVLRFFMVVNGWFICVGIGKGRIRQRR